MTKQKVCKCGKGYESAYDKKCGHCRTRKEAQLHLIKLNKNSYDKKL